MSKIQMPPFKRRKSMTSKDRVYAAITHTEPDLVPFDLGETRISGIHANAYTRYREKLGLPLHNYDLQIPYLQLPEIGEDFRSLLEVDLESVDPNTKVRETEIVKTEGGCSYKDMWNSTRVMPEGGNYFDIITYPLSDAETVKDVKKFPWPSGNDERYFLHMPEQISKIIDHDTRAVFVGRTCPGIFEMVQVLRGYEKAFLDFAGNLKIAEAVMDAILAHKFEYYKKIVEIMKNSNVDYYIISESDDFGSQNGLLISPDLYKKVIKPRHRELFSMLKKESGGTCFIELHSCGSIRKLIPDLIDAGVEILNPVQVSADDMNTRELKCDFGDSIVFHGGGIDSQYTLPYGTPEEIKNEVKRHIEELGVGGGFIFTPVHSIQYDVPFENFSAMIEAYREYA